jgi:hypothetical protein
MHSLNIYGGKAWSAELPIRLQQGNHSSGDKPASAWDLPLTSLWRRTKWSLELYLQSRTFPHGMVPKLVLFYLLCRVWFGLVSETYYSEIYFHLKQFVCEFGLSSIYLFIHVFIRSFIHSFIHSSHELSWCICDTLELYTVRISAALPSSVTDSFRGKR